MKRSLNLVTAILLAFLALPFMGQPERTPASKTTGCRDDRGPEYEDRIGIQVIRIIEDFATHRRWLLERDSTKPSAPARLVPLPAGRSCAFLETHRNSALLQGSFQSPAIPVIRAGDTLLATARSSVSDTEVEAIALTAASVGEGMRVRLKVGGGSLRAIAIAPGRAMLIAQAWESRP